MSCVVYPELVEKGPKSPKSERCGDCHRDIYAEWKDSPHASSFINSAFREETNKYQFTFCIGCHAPETIFTNEKIEPRGVNREEGVNCNSCHLNDCKLSGPTPAHGPHPITEKAPFFRTSELCGKCHVSTFKAWQESDTAEGRKTCQDCHMPAIKRKLIQDDPWQKIYPKREGKQHFFSPKALLHGNENPLKLSFIQVVCSDGKVEGVLELENTGIPHSVPTGDYGYREVVVTIALLDKAGRIVDLKNESLFVELKTALPYKGKKRIPFCFCWSENLSVIKATMIRNSFHKDRNILLAETIYNL
ncbi:MAG: multiheme c-type cytochrome [Candidatus Brocadia sp.]